MTRRTVWLSPWEWDCCGGPLVTGDDVTLSVWPMDDDHRAWLTETVGAELTARIDGVEMHHEQDPAPQRLTGMLQRLSTVSMPSRLIHTERPPLPPDSPSSPLRLIGTPGGGVFMGAVRSAYVAHREAIPGAPVIQETPQIPLRRAADHPDRETAAQAAAQSAARAARAIEAAARAAQTTDPPPPGEVERRLVGYLVELELNAS